MLEARVNNSQTYQMEESEGKWLLNGHPADFDVKWLPNGLVSVLYNGECFTAIVEKTDRSTKEIQLRIDGHLYQVALKEPIDQLLRSMGMDKVGLQKAESVKAPMPGMILKIMVEPGQTIKKGEGMIILEAMKMENVLKAASDAIVKTIRVTEKTAVEKGTVLIELE